MKNNPRSGVIAVPLEHDPLNTPEGKNAYDPLFADRIEALGKSDFAFTPTPRKPEKEPGTAFVGWIALGLVLGAVRIVTSLPSPRHEVPAVPRFQPQQWRHDLLRPENPVFHVDPFIEEAVAPLPADNPVGELERRIRSLEAKVPVGVLQREDQQRHLKNLKRLLEQEKEFKNRR
jgi:hypothetical protein